MDMCNDRKKEFRLEKKRKILTRNIFGVQIVAVSSVGNTSGSCFNVHYVFDRVHCFQTHCVFALLGGPVERIRTAILGLTNCRLIAKNLGLHLLFIFSFVFKSKIFISVNI